MDSLLINSKEFRVHTILSNNYSRLQLYSMSSEAQNIAEDIISLAYSW